MRLELQAELFQRYPLLFRQPGRRLIADPGEEPYLEDDAGPLDHYGIECGDGWLPLIEQVAALCEGEIRSMMMRRVPREVWPRCGQIKEKLGSLRVYVRGELSGATRAAIAAAETQSTQVCEVCGAPAELGEHQGYRLTQCRSCTVDRTTADATADWAASDQYLTDIRELLKALPK